MKYRCKYYVRGISASYNGTIEVGADNEHDARILAKRIVWARDFRDYNPNQIEIKTIQAA
jgi:hypothetical protein